MIILIGLVILVAAVVVGLAGVLSNGGAGHALSDQFAVFDLRRRRRWRRPRGDLRSAAADDFCAVVGDEFVQHKDH